MQLTEAITMTKEEALAKVREYRGALRVEDKLLRRGFRALAKGQRLIELSTVIGQGGIDERGLPRLAVLRADAQFCWATTQTDGAVTFADEQWPDFRKTTRIFAFPAGTLKEPPRKFTQSRSLGLRAIMPPIPPRHRPDYSLANYAVLWEATWEPYPVAPRDPALLRQLVGDLYVVLATWDLTPLERAVLAGMRRS